MIMGYRAISGNLQEWCLDAWDPEFYGKGIKENPIAGGGSIDFPLGKPPYHMAPRVLRGGSWNRNRDYIRVAARYKNSGSVMHYQYGFRCVVPLETIKSSMMPRPTRSPLITLVSNKDGSEMVLIPAGKFEMGSISGTTNTQPIHTVELGAYFMDRHEVTVGNFKEFINQTGYNFQY